MQGARAVGVSFGEPLAVSPAPTLGPPPSRPAWGLEARCCFETQPVPRVLASFPLAVPSCPGASNQLVQLLWKTGGGASKSQTNYHMTQQFHSQVHAPKGCKRGFKHGLVHTCS